MHVARVKVNSSNVNTEDVVIYARAKFVAAKVYVKQDKKTWSSGCLN